ncbi:MAG: universal stress protein [Acidobacteriota bacterium]
MIDFKRILCAVDFSNHSRRALDHAVAIARQYESAVTAVYVFPPSPAPAAGMGAMAIPQMMLTDVDRERLVRDLRAFAAVESAPGVVIDAVLREGYPATEIVDCAAALGANLIVMGTHGRSGVERLLLGSVAERVLRRAQCPVLTVPAGEPDAVPLGYPIFKSIVCPIDFSAASLLALDYALAMAREADAHLTILHVVALSLEQTMLDAASTEGSETLAEFRRRTEEDLKAQLQATVPADAADYCRVDTLMTRGKPGVEVVRTAIARHADLIVMGVHGRGLIDVILFGSTAQHVVRAAHCPVLTIGQRQ